MRFILALGLLPAILFAQGADTTGKYTDIGADFENYLESAATSGVGSAGVAWGLDPSAWRYNPATGIDAGSGVLFKHTSAFADEARVSNDLIAASYRTGFGGVGLAISRNAAGDIYLTTLPDTTRPVGPDNRPVVTDTVTASDWTLQLSGLKAWEKLSVGANLKLFYRNLVAATGFGAGVDLGIRYRFDWGLSLGARVTNVSTSPVFWSTGDTEFMVPRGTAGGMQEFRFGKQLLRLMLETDIGVMSADSMALNVGSFYLAPRGGLEFVISNVVALRVGRADYGWTVGAGGSYRGFFVDYAYRGHDIGLGGTHLVQAGYRF